MLLINKVLGSTAPGGTPHSFETLGFIQQVHLCSLLVDRPPASEPLPRTFYSLGLRTQTQISHTLGRLFSFFGSCVKPGSL